MSPLGAAAIREINQSPHADSALQLAKQQEVTRQHELALAMAQAQVAQV